MPRANLLTSPFTAALAAVLVSAGCASVQPPAELVNARNAYQAANNAHVRQWAPTEFHEAEQSLEQAEQIFAEEPDDERVPDIAYVAARQAEQARAAADRTRALHRSEELAQQYTRELEMTAERRAEELSTTADQLVRVRGELTEREQRIQEQQRQLQEAEQRLQSVLERLDQVASLQRDQRGRVITISGEVLFRSGQSQLLPVARQRLGEVAQAIRDYEGNILVVGHTDSVGSDAMNQGLSLLRAQSVAQFLAQHGVEENQLESVGRGETEPIASNDTSEGRATNRRVEIILQDPEQQQRPQQQMRQQQRPQQEFPQPPGDIRRQPGDIQQRQQQEPPR